MMEDDYMLDYNAADVLLTQQFHEAFSKKQQFAQMYGASTLKLDQLKLDGLHQQHVAYEEADLEWQMEKTDDQWRKGILTQDEWRQMTRELVQNLKALRSPWDWETEG